MFDTMTLTKILGAGCGALLVLLMGNWVAEGIYGHGGHHGDDHAQGYLIEVVGAEVAEAEPEEEIDFGALMAAADIEKGEKVFGKCRSCHKLEDGVNGTGPHLYSVVDRDVGAVGEFRYSNAMAEFGGVWDVDQLNGFLESPKDWVSGTKMVFGGLKKPEDRANLIAYLGTIGG